LSRYSQLYVERDRPEQDSKRARIRIHNALLHLVSLVDRRTLFSDLLTLIKEETGADIPVRGYYYDQIEFSICETPIRDLLDTVTVIHTFLQKISPTSAAHWLSTVGRIFEEENLAYRVGADGIVRPFVDVEFEVNRAAALEALGDPRFGEARTDFEAAHRHFRDGSRKEALRMMFPAVEVAAKVLFPGAFARLMPHEVDKHLKPAVERRYSGNEPAIAAGRLLLDGMKDWIAAAQLYRHGQQQEESAEPPMDFVIAHFSAGATYLRWMIELCSDSAKEPSPRSAPRTRTGSH
jgi:hypothetical protein